MANEANDATEVNKTDEAEATEFCEEVNKANCSVETIEACPLEYILPIKSSEWYFGICIDRSCCNNQLGSGSNNQLGLDLYIVANKAIGVANMANELNKLDGHVVVICRCRLRLDNAIAITLYSLTKYSAITTEVKEYFGISAPNNQHG